ncbi:helix-turn-helix domain-containing protein [Variovorax saccharolyticus]|uniref:helix-turn-helix domain-containing protein n=1 Tax=Variovorax saccharolyticus TaxID=3053516 RepID=UPI0025754F33|nr:MULTISPECIES: helix-turn-helix domain-containing protein [unclassified Variovorax]MDM0016126.1 helix-turn-helix domain-containing protein [Variovorax sp. J22R187]MDM0027051.1 helix-turn-helix domain-containing protein [Variovorax sp. J31P216]
MTHPSASPLPERSLSILQARREWIDGERAADPLAARVEPWLVRSWQRCLAAGHRPQQRVSFDPVSAQGMRRATERNRALVTAARPVLERLSRAIADTRYFAILTDADGIVVDVGALPSGSDPAARHARDIARIGVDLSERAVGTTAIGAALAERESVWLHRGEHFFDDTSIYSCAGAPLFGPQGDCIGMLDLTGVQVVERPELRHLAASSARSIENALVLGHPCELLLQIGWPGSVAGTDAEGLLCIDADGNVTGANAAARHMLHQPLANRPALHCNDLFALPPQMLFDAARRDDAVLEVPLWSGLRVQARPRLARPSRPASTAAASPPRLRDLESALIRKAVDDARGNVAEAARTLGISRATVYRKLVRGAR